MRTSAKCQKIENVRAVRAKLVFFVVKCANLYALVAVVVVVFFRPVGGATAWWGGLSLTVDVCGWNY